MAKNDNFTNFYLDYINFIIFIWMSLDWHIQIVIFLLIVFSLLAIILLRLKFFYKKTKNLNIFKNKLIVFELELLNLRDQFENDKIRINDYIRNTKLIKSNFN